MFELIMLLALSAQSQPSQVFPCTVVQKLRVECQRKGGKTVVIRRWDFDQEPFTEWLWQPQYRPGAFGQPEIAQNEPLVKVRPKVGQKLKAVMIDGAFVPVASCDTRIWRAVNNYAKSHPGQLIPGSLRTAPDDCQPWYGKEGQ